MYSMACSRFIHKTKHQKTEIFPVNSLFNRELGKPRDMIKSDMKILRAKAKMRLTFLLFCKREKRAIYGGFRDSLRMVQINLVANTACSGALCVIFSDRGEVLDCMAGRMGFEPTIGVSPYNDLANRRLQPLGHLPLETKKFKRNKNF